MGMKDISVSDLMSTALMTVGPRDTVERADLDMKLAGIRHFPVVDERNHLIGVVSDRDLLRAFGSPEIKRVVIKDIMSKKVQTVTEDMAAVDAVESMLEHKIGCLPVVGDDGHLVGLVTETDFMLVAFRALNGEDLTR